MHVLKDKQGKVINNFNEIVKIAENFYTELYSSLTDHATLVKNSQHIHGVNDDEWAQLRKFIVDRAEFRINLVNAHATNPYGSTTHK